MDSDRVERRLHEAIAELRAASRAAGWTDIVSELDATIVALKRGDLAGAEASVTRARRQASGRGSLN